MSSVRTSSSSVEHADNEKAQHLKVVTYDKSIVDDDEYDLDDPKNYSTNYVDEYNPRGLRVPTKTGRANIKKSCW